MCICGVLAVCRGAGQGVGSIDDVPSVEEVRRRNVSIHLCVHCGGADRGAFKPSQLVSRIEAEFHATTSYLSDTSSTLSQYPRGGSK